MGVAPRTVPAEAYEGEPNPAGFHPRLTNTGITLVIGGNLNPFGHAMFRLGRDVGWIHVHRILAFPDVVMPDRFHEYLRTNNKNVYADIDVRLPSPRGALRKIEELRQNRWPWVVVPHNCVNFCEQIVQAGGADWSSITNLPYLITFLSPWMKEPPPTSFQATVQIDGPRRLRRGQTAVYRARTIGLPERGNFRWWPKVGHDLAGLHCSQMAYGEVTLRATEDSGKSAVMVKYVADSREWNGRLEVALGL